MPERGRRQSDIARPTHPCADCGASANVVCSGCRESICSRHLQLDRWGARNLFGPWFLPERDPFCEPCYREKLWTAWRTFAFAIAAVGAIVGPLQGKLWPVGVAVLVAAVWMAISNHEIRLAQSDRKQRSCRT